ncbi:MAG TPA: sigma-54 dependent transcriptional regulator [Nevskiaceae bacterium]|nr:sigma-54 dependent transcriptional regulator [Nevskiaceae bacterium]
MSRILIVEDETLIRSQLARRLQHEGYDAVEADSTEAAVARRPTEFDLIIADVRLPGAAGTELIELAGKVPVLIMTSFASISAAVEAMKRGAADYIAKPFDYDELLLTIRRILDRSLLQRQNTALKNDLGRNYPIDGIIGKCAAMREIHDRIRRVAAVEVPVLILGESGTGKELVARAIHGMSPRAGGPFVAVNSSAIPENLIESELFGHEKGAFTGASRRKTGLFEAAHGGTLFLDEVGDLAPATQVRLLRVLQEGEVRPVGATETRHVDVRVLAATHRDVAALIANGGFRSDLYYRLAVMDIKLPPLRDRGDDIDLLAEELLRRVGTQLNRPRLKLGCTARRALHDYGWPGNVRELGNVLERAAILSDADTIERIDPVPAGRPTPPDPGQLSLDEYFRHYVLEHETDTTESELAHQLGISRKSLWERRRRMGIPRGR